ncbi:MAG: hypothetical protein GX488_05020 [Clostridiales bacterium]|nr:hypothetical protein [Clostridiales bacterium]
MKSETSFFNRTLFFNLYKRYWPIFASYFIIWLIVLPLSLANSMQYASEMTRVNDIRESVASVGLRVLNQGIYGGAIMSAIFSILIAMAAFGYLYNARSVSMMCSLPIKREGVFVSVFSAGLAGMFAVNIIIFLITMAVEGAYGASTFGPSYLYQWLAMVCMMNLFFFGFATFCASLTGNIFVLPAVYVILNFTAYIVEFCIRTIMQIFIYGASPSAPYKFTVLSPFVKIAKTHPSGITENVFDGSTLTYSYISGYYYEEWSTLAVYAVIGLVFAVCAMLIIKHRRMETAGDVVAVNPLKPVFKYCLSIGCALVLGILIFQIVFGSIVLPLGKKNLLFIFTLLFMVFGAFIGYFSAEMLIQKTLRVFSGRKWIGFGITAVVISVIMFCGEYDVFGYERKIPDISDIKSVNLACSGESVVLERPENISATIDLHSSIISHKNANESCTDGNTYYVYIIYTLKNGKTFEREYHIYSKASDDIFKLADLMNVNEAVNYRKALSVPVSINTIADAYISYFDKTEAVYKNIELPAEQAYELYSQCIIPDINDGTLGKVWFETDSYYMKNVFDCTINFSIQQRIKDNNYNSDYFYTTLTVDSARTYKWIREKLGINLCSMGESKAIQEAQNNYKESGAASLIPK